MGNYINVTATKDKEEQIFALSKNPAAIYVRPDLSKFVMIGNNGSMSNKPYYSIYDISTKTQIEDRLYVDTSLFTKGAYSFGYFDEDNKTLVTCISIYAKKIFYINTDTGKYTEKEVNPSGEMGNDKIEELIQRSSKSKVSTMNGYSFHYIMAKKAYESRVDIFLNDNKPVKSEPNAVKRIIHQGANTCKAWFMIKHQLSEKERWRLEMLIYGWIRSVMDHEIISTFPMDLVDVMVNYNEAGGLYLISHSNKFLKINMIDQLDQL